MQLRRKEPRVCAIPISDITPNPHQPRRYFDDAALCELAESIRAHGILQPLTVRRRDGGGYELIAGERRLRAAGLAGLTAVPCLLSDVGEREASLLALVENLQRRDLHYLEEAAAIARLITDFSLTQEELARQLGRSPSAVANK
ncbi:MAG: ParB/RepB/Spo0J family partition protein, partial [Oscillospiraceae bacterium]